MTRTIAIPLAFFLTGFASLMDQVVWLRYLGLIFGNTTQATSTLLAIFMAGLGFGSLWGGKWADKSSKPHIIYVVAEIVIGILAISSPYFFKIIEKAYIEIFQTFGDQSFIFILTRIVLATFFLLPPTFLMGATLPLIVKALTRSEKIETVRSTALLYGINTAGAVAGTSFSGFYFIKNFGLIATLYLSAILNFIAALIVIIVFLGKSWQKETSKTLQPDRSSKNLYLTLFALMGATSLGYEVIWSRVLVLYIGSSVYSYSLMLTVFLIGIAIGSILVNSIRYTNKFYLLFLVETVLAIWIVIHILLFAKLNEILVLFAKILAPTSYGEILLVQLLSVALLLIIPTVCMGISFPLAVDVFLDFKNSGEAVGAVYSFNTIGSIAGSILTGFLLIPTLGTQNSLLLLSILNFATGLAFLYKTAKKIPLTSLLVPVIILLSFIFLPKNMILFSAGTYQKKDQRIIHFEEDVSGTVVVRELKDLMGKYLSLEINGVNVAGTSPDLYAIQMLQGHIPLALADKPKKILHIGFGSGGTAWAVSLHKVNLIKIVEINPLVLKVSNIYFRHINHGVLADSRVRTVINDGRNFLLASREKFDCILSDSIHPRYAGNSTLYTLEYFKILADNLEKDGIASMWLPMYSLTSQNFFMILKSFNEVFPYINVWYELSTPNSFTIVTGSFRQPKINNIYSLFNTDRIKKELESIDIYSAADIVAMHLADQNSLKSILSRVPPHIDDIPAVEYESGTLIVRNIPWLTTFSILLQLRSKTPPPYLVDGENKEIISKYLATEKKLYQHLELLKKMVKNEP